MKRVISVHGWGGYPQEGWRPWLGKELSEKGFEFINPEMPYTENPTQDKWVTLLAETIGKPNGNTYLIGHSLGCITILRYLEGLKPDEKVGGVILVAGFGEDLEYNGYKGELSSFFQTEINWEEIKKHCNKFIAIHSKDDPWVLIKNNKLFEEKLGARSIIQNGMKHYSGDDGLTELPLVRDLILEISTQP